MGDANRFLSKEQGINCDTLVLVRKGSGYVVLQCGKSLVWRVLLCVWYICVCDDFNELGSKYCKVGFVALIRACLGINCESEVE